MSARHEGDLIILDLVTYGYGEEISWEDLQTRVNDMEMWAKLRGLDYEISISALTIGKENN